MIIIPVIPSRADQTLRITLDALVFVLRLRHMARTASWYLDLLDEASDPIQTQIRIVTGYQLLWRIKDPRRPPGDIYAFGGDGSSNIGLAQLGDTVPLYYMTRAEIDGLKALPDPLDVLTVTSP